MAEDLGQADQIAGIVFQDIGGPSCAEARCGCKLEAADGSVLVAQGPKATVGQRSPFANEDPTRLNGWAGFEVSGKGFACRQRPTDTDRCLLPFPYRNVTEPLRSPIIRSWRSKATKIADPTARVEHHGEDRRRSDIVSQFDLPQQFPHLGSVQSFGSEGRPLQLLDRLAGIGGDMAMFDQPAKESTDGDQVAVDRRHGLATVLPQVVPEIGDVPGRDPTDREPFAIAGGEPLANFLMSLVNARREWCAKSWAARKSPNRDAFVLPNRNAVENIITTILHALSPTIWTRI